MTQASMKLKAITGLIVLATMMLMVVESTYHNYCYPRRCLRPSYFDWETCKCKECEIKKCEIGQLLNPRRCRCENIYRQCVCKLECTPPYILHPRKCECVCDRMCSRGHKQNDKCECIPLTCKTALTPQECFAATCSDDSRRCAYTKSNKCVCPCCVSDKDPSNLDYCNDKSLLGPDQCKDDELCTYICPLDKPDPEDVPLDKPDPEDIPLASGFSDPVDAE